MDDGVLCHNAVLGRIDLDNLELDLSHSTTNDEEVTLANRAVGLTEVGGKEDIEERAGDTLDGIGNGKYGNALGLWTLLAIAMYLQNGFLAL